MDTYTVSARWNANTPSMEGTVTRFTYSTMTEMFAQGEVIFSDPDLELVEYRTVVDGTMTIVTRGKIETYVNGRLTGRILR